MNRHWLRYLLILSSSIAVETKGHPASRVRRHSKPFSSWVLPMPFVIKPLRHPDCMLHPKANATKDAKRVIGIRMSGPGPTFCD